MAGSTDDMPTVVLAVTSDKDQQALADQLDRTVVPALEDIKGVGRVSVDGVQDLQVNVTPDPKKLAAAGLNTMTLGDALKASGATIPGGSFSEDGKSRTVKVGTPYTSLKQIEDLRIKPQQGATVRLGDIATVKQQPSQRVSITRPTARRASACRSP